jgi:chlorophyll(ide) b reductase
LGHRVCICSTNESNLNNAMKELKEYEGKIFSFVCDVSNEKLVQDFVNFSEEKLKVIDIWINNAGVPSRGEGALLDDLSIGQIQNCVNINILGSLYSSKYVLKLFKKQSHGHLFEMNGFGSHDQVF